MPYPGVAPPPLVPTPGFAATATTPEVAHAQDQTIDGLRWLAVGFGIGWIPLVGLVGGILGLVGLIMVFQGRRGFGPTHHRYVVWAGVLILVSIVGAVAASVVVSWIEFSTTSALLSGSSAHAIPGVVGWLEALVAVSTVLGVLGGLAIVLLVFQIADGTARRALWIAFGLGAVIAGGGAVLTALSVTAATTGSASLQAYTTDTDLLDVAGAIPSLLRAWAYYHVRQLHLVGEPT